MKPSTIVSALVLAGSIAALTAADEAANKQLNVYSKNIARQHVGANLFYFNTTSQSYAPTEAAAAWLDDDVTTAWPVLAGKQHYLLSLGEPTMLTNFALSARTAAGKVTIYAGDEAAAPGAASWSPVLKDVSLDTINDRRLSRGLNRLAKYLLIEADLTEAGPIYSLFVYGDQPSAAYNIVKRDQPLDTKASFGPFVNQQTAFSQTGLYAKALVTYANSPANSIAWQRAIDDNPETGLTVAPSETEAAATIRINQASNLARVAALTDNGTKGKLDFFVAGTAPELGKASAIAGSSPVATITFDGSSNRGNADFAPVSASALLVRWTPENGSDSITLREINAFSDYSLTDYALAGKPAAIADATPAETTKEDSSETTDETTGTTRRTAKTSTGTGSSDKNVIEPETASNDGKEVIPPVASKDSKDGKAMLPPAVADRNPVNGYRPPYLVFPPNVNVPRVATSNPNPTPVPPVNPTPVPPPVPTPVPNTP